MVYFFSRYKNGACNILNSSFYIGIERDKLNNFLIRIYITFIIFVTLILLPRLDNYKVLINNPLEITQLTPPVIEYYDQSETLFWGVRSNQGDQCWVNLDCTPGPVIIEEASISTYQDV